jgi:HK97 family phage prohead protease
MQLERKLLPIDKVDLKTTEADGGVFRVSGYGSTFGGPPDSYGDIIVPGAFSVSLRSWAGSGRSLPMLFNHDADKVIGKWPRVVEDERGLRVVDGELTPGHSVASDVKASLKHGTIDGLSIGFVTKAWEPAPRGAEANRLLREIDLWELSVVTMPANDFARITDAKSISTPRDLERALRELGFSHRQSQQIVRGGWKALSEARDELDGATTKHGPRDEDGGGLSAILESLKALRVVDSNHR